MAYGYYPFSRPGILGGHEPVDYHYRHHHQHPSPNPQYLTEQHGSHGVRENKATTRKAQCKAPRSLDSSGCHNGRESKHFRWWGSLFLSSYFANAYVIVVQEIYDKHRLVDQDTGFTRIPKHILAEAKSDLIKRLPLVFEKCETDWFADWALNRRHLKRNRGRQSTSVQQQQQQFPEVPPPGGFDVPPRSNGSSTYPGDTGMYSTLSLFGP